MNDDVLVARLRGAVAPYIGGFCLQPATITIRLTNDLIELDVTLRTPDYQRIADVIERASAIEEAFIALCRANTLHRAASLAFVDGGP